MYIINSFGRTVVSFFSFFLEVIYLTAGPLVGGTQNIACATLEAASLTTENVTEVTQVYVWISAFVNLTILKLQQFI